MRSGGAQSFIVLVFLVMTLPSPVTAQTDYSVTAYVAMRPVTVDGKWTTPDEWTDSANVTFGYGTFGERQHFNVKHDSRFVYVLLDFVADKRLDDKDNSWVYLDTKGDGGTAPKNDDYGFGINFVAGQPIFRMKRGTGTGWKEPAPSASPPIEGFWAWASMDPSNDPYLSTPHSIYEFKIPKTILEESTAVGFRVVVADELGQVEWPPRTSSLSPSQWGTLTLSVVSVAERGLVVDSSVLPDLVALRLYPSRNDSILPYYPTTGCNFSFRAHVLNNGNNTAKDFKAILSQVNLESGKTEREWKWFNLTLDPGKYMRPYVPGIIATEGRYNFVFKLNHDLKIAEADYGNNEISETFQFSDTHFPNVPSLNASIVTQYNISATYTKTARGGWINNNANAAYVCMSSDGSYLAIQTNSGKVALLDGGAVRFEKEFEYDSFMPCPPSLSENSIYLAFVIGNSIHLVSSRAGSPMELHVPGGAEYPRATAVNNEGHVLSADWMPNVNVFLAKGYRVWSRALPSGDSLPFWGGGERQASVIRFAGNGKAILVALTNVALSPKSLWRSQRPHDGEYLHLLDPAGNIFRSISFPNGISSAAVSDDASRIIVGCENGWAYVISGDGTTLWKIFTGIQYLMIGKVYGGVSVPVALSPDGKWFSIGTETGVYILDEFGKPRFRINVQQAMSLSMGHGSIAVGSNSGAVVFSFRDRAAEALKIADSAVQEAASLDLNIQDAMKSLQAAKRSLDAGLWLDAYDQATQAESMARESTRLKQRNEILSELSVVEQLLSDARTELPKGTWPAEGYFSKATTEFNIAKKYLTDARVWLENNDFDSARTAIELAKANIDAARESIRIGWTHVARTVLEVTVVVAPILIVIGLVWKMRHRDLHEASQRVQKH